MAQEHNIGNERNKGDSIEPKLSRKNAKLFGRVKREKIKIISIIKNLHSFGPSAHFPPCLGQIDHFPLDDQKCHRQEKNSPN